MDRLSTPTLVVERPALDANLAAMQRTANECGVVLRPHAKGHRAPWVAERQVAAGAVGIAVATVAEAALFVGAGVSDVLLTSVVAPGRADALAALAANGQTALGVVVHTEAVAQAFGLAAREHGVVLRVLVDLDVGQRRGGVGAADRAVAVADAVAAQDGLRLDGVQAYDGHLQGLADAADRAAGHAAAMARLDDALGALRDAGHACATVSSAGTATAPLAAAHPSVTEIQPGSYALMDATYADLPGVAFRQAAFVLTTVTAVLGLGEVLVDAGTRALSTDLGPPMVVDRDAVWLSAGDEHGRVRGDVHGLRPGDVIAIAPSHTDTTVVLHDLAVGVDSRGRPARHRRQGERVNVGSASENRR